METKRLTGPVRGEIKLSYLRGVSFFEADRQYFLTITSYEM